MGTFGLYNSNADNHCEESRYKHVGNSYKLVLVNFCI